jgi:response regulator RpfG family c-di-GMP phosphodiesterase
MQSSASISRTPSPPAAPARPGLPRPARSFLNRLVRLQLVTTNAADGFLEQTADHHPEYRDGEALGEALVHGGLLTEYQLRRVLAGQTHGLLLGNYRVVDRLGAGAMGVVFLGEHTLMKRLAAIKVFPVDEDSPAMLLERFYAEMRIQADLHHPNLVTAYDGGQLAPPSPGMALLLYLVMELVPGGDLEQYVVEHGPVPLAQACEWIRQAACGLQEAHDHHLIHRDVKPSNLLLTEQRSVKVGDFGLARQFSSRLTDPKALLGTLEYMAPEQSHDASTVEAQADIYGLGASLFWLLTGEPPFPPTRGLAEAVRQLQHTRPRRVRELRPEVPVALDDLIARMLDPDPASRPALPLTVMNALLPYAVTRHSSSEFLLDLPSGTGAIARTVFGASPAPRPRVLVVDDEPGFRHVARAILGRLGMECMEAEDAEAGWKQALAVPFDLVLLDLNLPGMSGYQLCQKLRARAQPTWQKIIVVSGMGDQNQLSEALAKGADDYIPKPFELRQLDAKVRHALRLKEAQDRADLLTQELLRTNQQLESSLAARTQDVRLAQDALLFAMAKMAESRDGETPGHLQRLQRYVRCLAQQAAVAENWAGVVDHAFLEQLERCTPLHDIGKIGLPDHVLLKPGPLDPEERELMKTHTLIGDRILEALGREHGQSLGFLGTATAIVRHHHERYDGQGYPDGLAGDDIPAAARLVAVADVYDALRRRRYHKPALGHEQAVHILLCESAGQFDPALLRAFEACAAEFERIYRAVPM